MCQDIWLGYLLKLQSDSFGRSPGKVCSLQNKLCRVCADGILVGQSLLERWQVSRAVTASRFLALKKSGGFDLLSMQAIKEQNITFLGGAESIADQGRKLPVSLNFTSTGSSTWKFLALIQNECLFAGIFRASVLDCIWII